MRNIRLAVRSAVGQTNVMKPLLFLVPLLFLAACSLPSTTASNDEQYFLKEVKPVLQQQCLRCHNGTLPAPALNLSNRAAVFKHSPKGKTFIVPHHPEQSALIKAVQRGGTHPRKMPHTDISLTDDQIGMLREWIADGAFWPEDERGNLKPQRSGENP
ncbi:MAG: hypothetical protein JWO89_2319 [Verrucomicrobiaceae bacterium]|nr:hypothetical protein [Verrucomicrobiaceae bacterium]